MNFENLKEVESTGSKRLRAKLVDLEDHIFQLRVQRSTGQLASPAMMKVARKELARVRTAISESNVKGLK
ncbi:MAG: 50S ribosomal protein L29 [Oligoflexia bacterium]|nr:50S ribosomal protein L29 [Oligoflexia bacterium]